MRAVTGALIACAVAAAWMGRWVQDDAFISFTYARNLVEGHGLTWFEETVQGYTNLLWVLWSAMGQAAGLDAIAFAHASSFASYGLVLWLTARLARRLSASAWAPPTAVAVLATNFTVAAYGTGGLETMLQTALCTAVLLGCQEPAPTRWRMVGLSLLAAAALLTRLDSAVLVAAAGAPALWRLRRWAALLLAPGGLVLTGWAAWNLHTYGDLLPNTFYAKVGHGAVWAAGASYVWGVLRAYGLWAPPSRSWS